MKTQYKCTDAAGAWQLRQHITEAVLLGAFTSDTSPDAHTHAGTHTHTQTDAGAGGGTGTDTGAHRGSSSTETEMTPALSPSLPPSLSLHTHTLNTCTPFADAGVPTAERLDAGAPSPLPLHLFSIPHPPPPHVRLLGSGSMQVRMQVLKFLALLVQTYKY
jgi:hypothetical protein